MISQARNLLTLPMGIVQKWLLAIGIGLVLSWLAPQFAYAATVCSIGCDETSIGAVLADSQYDGQDITVFPGTYGEGDLFIVGRNLVSNSDNPADTIIDGEGAARSGGVVIASGVTIRGFTITGGNNTGSAGGGIRGDGGTVRLENLIVENNTSVNAGGGIGAHAGSTIFLISDSVIKNNTSQNGGGIWGYNVSVIDSQVLTNNAIAVTFSQAYGGGINVSLAGAGFSNTLFIKNSTIKGNKAVSALGATYGGGINAGDVTTLENTSVEGNDAIGLSSSFGGGLFTSGSDISITGGTFSGNTAMTRGGGIYQGSCCGTSIIDGVSITSNIVEDTGGGVYCNGNLQSLQSNVVNNTPNDTDGVGCDAISTSYGVGDDSQANDESGGTDGDPVSTFTGELFTYLPADINLGGPLPLAFSRYYAYRLELAKVRSTLGTNWRHNYAWTLSRVSTEVEIVTGDGRRLSFSDNGSSWDQGGKTDHLYQLEETAGGFILTDMKSELQRDFDTSARFVTLRDGFGNTHTLTYGNDGQLAAISDGLGRTEMVPLV